MSRIINIINNLNSLALILVNLFLLFRTFSSSLPYPWFSGSTFFRSLYSSSNPINSLTTLFFIYNFPHGLVLGFNRCNIYNIQPNPLLRVRYFSTQIIYFSQDIDKLSYISSTKGKKGDSLNSIEYTKSNSDSTYTTLESFYINDKRLNSVNINKSTVRFDVNLFILNMIKNMLDKKPINRDTQLEIENFIFNQCSSLNDNIFESVKDLKVLNIDFNLSINKDFNKYILTLLPELKKYLKNCFESLDSDSKLLVDSISHIDSKKNQANFILKNCFIEFSTKDKDIDKHRNKSIILDSIIYILLYIITYQNITGEDINKGLTKTSVLSISILIGGMIVRHYIYSIYLRYKNKNSELDISLSEFKNNILENKHYFEDSVILSYIGSRLLDIMMTLNMVEIIIKNLNDDQKISTVVVSNTVYDSVKEHINKPLVSPFYLPMIVEPKDYSFNKLGGYLLNDEKYTEDIFTEKIGYQTKSSIENENLVLYTLNKMMKTPFKINKDLLNYLLDNNEKLKLLIPSDYKHKFSHLNKRNKYQEKEYQQFLSNKLLQGFILSIAITYSDVPEIYFPLRLDNRGRLYTMPHYLTYQGHELGRALLLFSKPGFIKRNDKDSIDFLKAYGATCYGNGLEKKSYEKRLVWIVDNWENIINFKTSNIVSEAEDKFLFLAFCFEINRFNNFLNNSYETEFKTYLPIQLDGTCNGFQHLAMLSSEINIMKMLNLTKATIKDDPQDFYNSIIDQVNLLMQERIENKEVKGEVLESYKRLLTAAIGRTNVKSSIMTLPYNATNWTLIDYILNTLTHVKTEKKTLKINDEEKDKFIGWYKSSPNLPNDNLINIKDIRVLTDMINYILFVKFPRIKLLKEYLDGIVDLLNYLNLPIVWRLPSGLRVTQKYMKKTSKRIKPFIFKKTILTLSVIDKKEVDKKKQKIALMPNLIHSLDSCSLFLLYNTLDSYINNKSGFNFYSVHDCYAVTANNIKVLISQLKHIYIDLYSKEEYIYKFDEDIINSIIVAYGSQAKFYPIKRLIKIDGREYILPNIPKVKNIKVKKEFYENISKSFLLIK